jgi:hypothetical protein
MTDLDLILARDPRQHTKDDRDQIIRMYRERRHQYNSGPQKAPAKPKKAPKAKPDEVLSLHEALKGSLDL